MCPKVANSAFPVVASLHPGGGAGEATTGNTSVYAVLREDRGRVLSSLVNLCTIEKRLDKETNNDCISLIT